MSRLPCKDYSKGTCTYSFCEKWHLPECLFYKSENRCRFGEKCSCAHRQVDEQPSKRSKNDGDKSAVAMLKRHEQHQRRVLIKYTTIGLRISRYGAAEVYNDFAEELKHTEANPTCIFFWRREIWRCLPVDDIKNSVGKAQLDPMWKRLMTQIVPAKSTRFLAQVYSGCTQREC